MHIIHYLSTIFYYIEGNQPTSSPLKHNLEWHITQSQTPVSILNINVDVPTNRPTKITSCWIEHQFVIILILLNPKPITQILDTQVPFNPTSCKKQFSGRLVLLIELPHCRLYTSRGSRELNVMIGQHANHSFLRVHRRECQRETIWCLELVLDNIKRAGLIPNTGHCDATIAPTYNWQDVVIHPDRSFFPSMSSNGSGATWVARETYSRKESSKNVVFIVNINLLNMWRSCGELPFMCPSQTQDPLVV